MVPKAKSAGWSTWLAVNRAAYLKPEDPNAQETLEALRYFRDGPLKLTLGEIATGDGNWRGSFLTLGCSHGVSHGKCKRKHSAKHEDYLLRGKVQVRSDFAWYVM